MQGNEVAADLSDDAANPRWTWGFDKCLAFYWGGVFVLLICCCFALAAAVNNEMFFERVCVGSTLTPSCKYAAVTMLPGVFAFFLLWTLVGLIWLVRRRDYDAHPWLVGASALGFIFVCHTGLSDVWDPLAAMLSVDDDLVTFAGIVVFGTLGAMASTGLKIRRPTMSWVTFVTAIAPFGVAVGTSATFQSSAELTQMLRKQASHSLGRSVDRARWELRSLPELRRQLVATDWLDVRPNTVSEPDVASIGQVVGPVDVIGRGRDVYPILEWLQTTAGRQEAGAGQVLASTVDDALLENLYIIGRRQQGYCLASTQTHTKPEWADVQSHGADHVDVTPIVHTTRELIYCVVDQHIYAPTDGQPRLIGTLKCPPHLPPSKYGGPKERAAVDFLTDHANRSTATFGTACPAPIGKWTTAEPNRWGRTAAGQRSAPGPVNPPKDDFTQQLWRQLQGSAFGRNIDRQRPENWENSHGKQFFSELIDLLTRDQRNPRLPSYKMLKQHFGPIIDAFSTTRLNRQIDVLAHRTYDSVDHAYQRVADGRDVARYIIGARRSGWCVYRASIPEPESTTDPSDRSNIDYHLRYCLAGHTLMSFDAKRRVNQQWDATGFVRWAPTVAATTSSNDPTPRTRRARNALVKQFVDALVAGKLTRPTQLNTLVMADGADQLDPTVIEAMKRMVRQSR